MILVLHISCCALSFLQTEYSITFDEAPKPTKQLWTFLLKISKVKRKGGVWGIDLLPISAPSALGFGLLTSSSVAFYLLSELEVFATVDVLTTLVVFTFFSFGIAFELLITTA